MRTVRHSAAEPDEGIEEEEADGEAVEKDQAVVSAEVSDMDYLRSRMTKAFAADEEEDEGASEDIQASWQYAKKWSPTVDVMLALSTWTGLALPHSLQGSTAQSAAALSICCGSNLSLHLQTS